MTGLHSLWEALGASGMYSDCSLSTRRGGLDCARSLASWNLRKPRQETFVALLALPCHPVVPEEAYVIYGIHNTRVSSMPVIFHAGCLSTSPLREVTPIDISSDLERDTASSYSSRPSAVSAAIPSCTHCIDYCSAE